MITACVNLDTEAWAESGAVVHTLRSLAGRIKSLTADEAQELSPRIEALVQQIAPALLEEHGVGVDSAAALLITAGDNPGRLTGEAALAALCGIIPVEHSSGKTQRHRLNRGGDRQANAALFRIVMTRLRGESRTVAYGRRLRPVGWCRSGLERRVVFNDSGPSRESLRETAK
ncbi:transposase [Nonomuraea sp. NPDC050786]|uniref:transposase n=1 Tax=Nonomuraea sp. NPDC050786 TaxID=3154840 RepID=UPI0033C61E3A